MPELLRGNNQLILLIDDEAKVFKALALNRERLSYQVESFDDPVMAVGYRKAASALHFARVKWDALPVELRVRQANLDSLVEGVENALEATLPPPTASDQGGPLAVAQQTS